MKPSFAADARELFDMSPMQDRRRYRRVLLELGGRFLDEHNEEHPLKTDEISCGGASIVSAHRPEEGSNIVCYIDEFARITGTVIRHTSRGFVVSFNIPDHKRDKLADRLVWLINVDPLGLDEDRTETRYPVSGPCVVQRMDGSRIDCRVLDISLSGAGFQTNDRPPRMGEIIHAGSLRGEVVRRERGFFAIQFIAPRHEEQTRLDELRDRHRKRFESL